MILEARTSQGGVYAEYKGQMAIVNFGKLLAASDLFKLETRKLGPVGSKESKEFPCFVAITAAHLNITDEFVLHIQKDDYIKVIR